MKVQNTTGNTLFVEDIDLHIPYDDGVSITLAPDLLKKSRSLRSLIIGGALEIIKHNPKEQIEKSIVYLRKKQIEEPPVEEETEKETEVFDEVELSASSDIEVKIHGIFYEAGGYGKVNRYLAKNLAEAGVKVQVSPKKGQNQLNRDELEEIVRLERTALSP